MSDVGIDFIEKQNKTKKKTNKHVNQAKMP